MSDPVKHCDLYKDKGCGHVDGYLCDMNTCKERLEYWMEKNVKWVQKAIYIHEKFMVTMPAGLPGKNSED